MAVISARPDREALALIVVSEFAADVESVWRVWEDRSLLERWWGPPLWPATFEGHSFVVGGSCPHYMTGPEGQKVRGWWTITAVEAPRLLAFDDGFTDENGDPVVTPKATHSVVEIEACGAGSRMTMTMTFDSVEEFERMLASGIEAGLRLVLGQIDVLLVGVPG